MSAIESDFVEVLVFSRKSGRISFLLLKRAPSERPYPGIWQVVSGRRNGEETAASAAVREIREEIGVPPVALWVLPHVNTFYEPSADVVQMVPTFAAEVPAGSRVSLSHEHTDFSWVTRKKAGSLVQWASHLIMMDLVSDVIVGTRGSVHRIPVI